VEDFVGAKFYYPHALAAGNQCFQIREKMLEWTSTVLSTFHTVSVPYTSALSLASLRSVVMLTTSQHLFLSNDVGDVMLTKSSALNPLKQSKPSDF